ncbi:MAG: magnesium transporter CorA family protein, partial [Spirochaetales bacterium]|nr:magnesium transporter CorA family protein [Spirochaetales bacterium]
MITIWKQSNNSIVRTAMLERHCWINVVAPDALEIETVKREYGIPEDIIRDILDVDERSRSEKDDTYQAVIFRVPVFTGNGEVQYYTVPLGVIITGDVFITISGMETEVTADFFENRVRGIRLDKPLDLLVRLFLQSARQYLRFLKAINRHTDALEGELQRAVKNTELIKLLRMEKSLVFFTTSLRANELLFVKLEKTLFKNLDDQGAELLEDAITEARQAVEMANIHSNILSG